jgi:hypothetical protein
MPQVAPDIVQKATSLNDQNDSLTRNSAGFGDARPATILAKPTPAQTRAFSLLRLKIAA